MGEIIENNDKREQFAQILSIKNDKLRIYHYLQPEKKQIYVVCVCVFNMYLKPKNSLWVLS